MSLRMVAEVWDIVSIHINEEFVEDVANELVDHLVDHGYDLDDIEYEFQGDPDIANAIRFHRDEIEEEAEYEDYDEDIEEDEWN